jgi:hypothetical protein
MRSGRPLFHQTLDALVGRLLERRFRASPSAVEKGGSLLPGEAGRHRIDGGARAEEDAGDLGGRETVRSEQHYVQPQPPARLAFSLHFPYKILAFGGGAGDTLHGRPFLLWLDGFGVFTMPQETVVCSIILCIYLVGCQVADHAFLATGSTIFNGASVGEGAEVRVNGTVHLRTALPAQAVVPIGWVAVG